MKKHISLPALFLLSALFISCGGEASTTTSDRNDTAPVTEAVTEATGYRAEYLPDVDYNGYEFRVIGYSDSYPPVVEKETGAIIDDAIFRRNQKVEEQYNIKLTPTMYPFTDYLKVSEFVAKAGRAQITQVQTPCVAVQSQHDEMVSRRSCQALSALPSLQLHILPHSRHFYYPPEDLPLLQQYFRDFCAQYE